MEYLFVYGTLMSEFKNKVWWQVEKYLQFKCKATLKGALYDLGDYPGYVDTEPGEVKGELYALINSPGVFEILDEYEGLNNNDPEYRRERKTVTLPDGAKTESWVYLYQRQLAPEHKRIIGGDYVAFIRNKVSK